MIITISNTISSSLLSQYQLHLGGFGLDVKPYLIRTLRLSLNPLRQVHLPCIVAFSIRNKQLSGLLPDQLLWFLTLHHHCTSWYYCTALVCSVINDCMMFHKNNIQFLGELLEYSQSNYCDSKKLSTHVWYRHSLYLLNQLPS